MDLTTVRALLRRHLVVALAGLVALLAVIGYVIGSVPLTQSVTGSVVLTAPGLSAKEAVAVGQIGAQNPMLNFSNALLVNANIVVKVLSSPASVKKLGGDGATAAYTLATSNDGVAPIVSVTAKSTSASTSTRTARIVLQSIRDELNKEQAAVAAPLSTYIRTEVVVAPDSAIASWSARIRDLAEYGILVLLATFVLILSADRLAARRVARRAAPEEPPVILDTVPLLAPEPSPAGVRQLKLQRRHRGETAIRVKPVRPTVATSASAASGTRRNVVVRTPGAAPARPRSEHASGNGNSNGPVPTNGVTGNGSATAASTGGRAAAGNGGSGGDDRGGIGNDGGTRQGPGNGLGDRAAR